MSFEAVLKEMVDGIDGGLAGLIIGKDGIAVQNYIRHDKFYDIESLAVEYSTMIEGIKKAMEVLNIGNIDEIAISAKNFAVFIRLINEKYFMALIAKSDEIHGKARFVLKKTALKIANEF